MGKEVWVNAEKGVEGGRGGLKTPIICEQPLMIMLKFFSARKPSPSENFYGIIREFFPKCLETYCSKTKFWVVFKN